MCTGFLSLPDNSQVIRVRGAAAPRVLKLELLVVVCRERVLVVDK